MRRIQDKHNIAVTSVHVTQGGNHVIWTCGAKHVKVWDTRRPECIEEWNGPKFNAIVPREGNGKFRVQVASIEDQDSFRLWATTGITSSPDSDPCNNNKTTTIDARVRNIRSCVLRFSSDGTKIASVDDFRGLRLFDTKTGAQTTFVKDTGLRPVNNILFGGNTVVAALRPYRMIMYQV